MNERMSLWEVLRSIKDCSCGKDVSLCEDGSQTKTIRYYVECECGKKTGTFSTARKAMEAWNKMQERCDDTRI